ncbi:MAG: AAA family ATPase [Anaerolineae bacterium]|nr:AAA family ATPase [Anaerolineae bacterium]
MDALRLVFITGVSRFSRVSLFSELNNLNDLTLHQRYAALLGYTQEELERYFTPHLAHFAGGLGFAPAELVARMRTYYDGYRFTKKEITVYNPFSTLKALDALDFGQYWFETGTPTFLINLLRDSAYPLPAIEDMAIDELTFVNYDIHNLKPEALLFQTGYVTIRAVAAGFYRLGYPNQEVKTAFLKQLYFSFMTGVEAARSSQFLRLAVYLQQESFDAFFETIKAIFASIPYDIQTKRDEAYYHTLFYLMVAASGVPAESSTLTSRGRIDLAVVFPDKVYIIEFKCNQSAQVAIQQIRDKGYADKYRQQGARVILVGVNFSAEARDVEAWQIEEV